MMPCYPIINHHYLFNERKNAYNSRYKEIIVAQCNRDFDNKAAHTVRGINQTGPYAAGYDGKTLN
jgi:hypothetical protein